MGNLLRSAGFSLRSVKSSVRGFLTGDVVSEKSESSVSSTARLRVFFDGEGVDTTISASASVLKNCFNREPAFVFETSNTFCNKAWSAPQSRDVSYKGIWKYSSILSIQPAWSQFPNSYRDVFSPLLET